MLVYLAVLLRVMAYEDMRGLLFRHQHDAQVRKAVLRLARSGWVTRWSVPVARVGRLGHVHPTARALRATLPRLVAATSGEPWAPLIRLMVPRTRDPLDLGPLRPKWFAHQREVNRIATTILRTRHALWMSTWDAPFPPAALGGIAFPQPDYVAVFATDHGPELIFGEHDRGSEPLDRFRDRKLRAYARLAARAGTLLGVPTFRVRVTVSEDAPGGAPQRLARLRNEVRAFGAADVYEFAAMPLA